MEIFILEAKVISMCWPRQWLSILFVVKEILLPISVYRIISRVPPGPILVLISTWKHITTQNNFISGAYRLQGLRYSTVKIPSNMQGYPRVIPIETNILWRKLENVLFSPFWVAELTEDEAMVRIVRYNLRNESGLRDGKQVILSGSWEAWRLRGQFLISFQASQHQPKMLENVPSSLLSKWLF